MNRLKIASSCRTPNQVGGRPDPSSLFSFAVIRPASSIVMSEHALDSLRGEFIEPRVKPGMTLGTEPKVF
jgi:hypothetical protein